MYFALIGDIMSSKSLEERTRIQEKLENYLNILNEKYEGVMKKKLAITLGDEFQALFQKGNFLLEIIHKIELEMYPTKLRFGIGIGNIVFDHGYLDSPYKSDGEAWWNARRAIDDVKMKNSKNKQEYYSNIYVISENEHLNNRVNIILDLCYSIKINWTEKQIDLIKYTIENYGFQDKFVYKDVANDFKQSVSTIFGKYNSAKYVNYMSVMNMITKEITKEEDENDF
ncbi:hypothetical protein BK011_08055 [Tenericutes bacterium MZ-XQ]|nr:hypothetical protein BK011_08055 [Tenericutes bacterium MZ-XQ]